MRFFETRQVGEILSRVSDASKVRDAISGTTLTFAFTVPTAGFSGSDGSISAVDFTDVMYSGSFTVVDQDSNAFTREQLQIYGIYELQTLETVLRQEGATAQETRAEVCNRIRRKIGWQGEEPVDPKRFLESFYAALRQHLENRMLFGERRESKHDRKE